MNESDIQPNYQSSDNHGVNDINFALFDFFGCQFAPRFANLNHKSQFLCGEKEAKYYPKNYPLKPSSVINQKLIIEEDMNIKRTIASLALKKATVSTIVKKICTSPKSNKTRKALAEYDKIIRSIYILNYIDDLNLRQYVQKAINRQELYHKLRRKVGFDNGGKIMVKPDAEQIAYQECNRLVCNMIVYYNSRILSEFLKQKEALGQKDQILALQQISPIAWRHINLYGKYEFESNSNNTDFDKINEILAGINLV
jgi:TnpA family transposase